MTGKPSKEYLKAVEERDLEMKHMSTKEKVRFLKEWHENMKRQLDSDGGEAEEDEDPEELK
jgi:hypothetical protein